MSRDQHRSAVYAAEDQLGRLLARGGTVDFYGSTLTLPVERRFADIASVQRYVDAVLALSTVRERWPRVAPVRVRERSGLSRAHYEPAVPERRSTATIAIPLAGPVEARWAARETVVLHEIAHHLVAQDLPPEPLHGPTFCGVLLSLIATAIGPEAALALRAAFDGAGIRVTEVAVGPDAGVEVEVSS
ncbi:MAG: TIGR04338 family metallohydrolase [Actinobacteria bacterium]|nr:TIGR04338 family metallohydrolase [Actinomycetota bacterium]